MGLSDKDIKEITEGWLETMTAVQDALLKAEAYTWSLIPRQANANASPVMLNHTNSSECAALIRDACSHKNPHDSAPLLFGVTIDGKNKTDPFPYVTEEVAAFLLMRGPYAYIGAGFWYGSIFSDHL